VIATAANIGSQMLAIAVYDGLYSIWISIFFGTGVGLSLKYTLDKRYIFRFRAQGLLQDGHAFMLYTQTGLLTTFIFWGIEYGSHVLFGSAEMRYLGGLIGLGIGYLAKYHLDKRYVFVKKR
jgi:putative flippase GtrA